jgi:hypothetical protein
MLKFYFLLIILLGFGSICWGQTLLFRKNNRHRELYKEGDVISFRIKNNKSKITRKIKGFDDSLIVFQDFKVYPHEITHFYINKSLKKGSKILFVGVGYPIIEFINFGVIDKKAMMIGFSSIAAGLLVRLLIRNKIEIKGRTKLSVIEYHRP